MTDVKRFEAALADGRVVVGPIQGCGGRIHDDAMRRLKIATRFAAEGRPLMIVEPEPGCVAMYPDETAMGPGEMVVVPLIGTTFREVTP